ncbi:MAG: sulfatase-like hydrolase/transferase [Anaerolineaceae bacterium]
MKEKRIFSQFIKSRFALWPKALLNMVLISYLFLLLEWSFFVTLASISFMYQLNFGEKVVIYLICGLAAALIAAAVLLAFCLLDLIVAALFPPIKNYLIVFPQAFLLSIFGLTVLDNFTYTIFHFGLSNVPLIAQIAYLPAFLAANFFILKKLAKLSAKPLRWVVSVKLVLALLLVGTSVGLLGVNLENTQAHPTKQDITVQATKSLPNIIIFGTDGLSASSMSLYGAKFETTPFLDELAKTSLVGENHFTNAGFSMGSDISMLTSKLPLETRVLYPPDILKGSSVDESLPNLLKSLGYETVQLAVPHYAEANAANLEGAFDAVNCANNSQLLYGANRYFSFRFNDEFYLLNTIISQTKTRLMEVFLIEKMDNPILNITDLKLYGASDKERMSCLFASLKKAKSDGAPLFAHLHLLTTHGSLFYSDHKQFSADLVQSKNWMEEFYADSILDYDGYVNELVDYLKANGEYENTIIVIYTDHGMQWTSDRRLPLLIHFPNNEYASRITANTQNLDIAPTLLDYLGVAEPSWMSGDSLLESISPTRLVVSAYTKDIGGDDSGLWGIKGDFIHPPFYQFSIVRAIQCQRMVTIDLSISKVYTTTVANYVSPCDLNELDSSQAIQTQLGELLTKYGFDLPVDWLVK